jgi:Domain of unknown function (DUF222)/HNH endonuclease
MDGATTTSSEPISVGVLAVEIIQLAGHLNSATRRWLGLLAEFDRRKGWAGTGALTCAHWMNLQWGVDLSTAHEKLRVAHALEKLPLIGAAMARGDLSYSKVRAVTRVADASNESEFLNIALHGTAQHVENAVRLRRHAQEAMELSREARQQVNRRMSYWFDEDGSMVMKIQMPAEVGAKVLKAIELGLEQMPLPEASAEASADLTPAVSARRVDALGIVAESFLCRGAEALCGGERHMITVHVDAETLKTRGAGRCEIEEGPSIAAETARRLACDASVVTITENERGEPLDIGRKSRSIPPGIQRALKSRDRGCRFPGCTHHRYVDGHHIRHWADGGETKLANLVLLCRFHHRLVHEGGATIKILDDGGLRFCKASGETLDNGTTI